MKEIIKIAYEAPFYAAGLWLVGVVLVYMLAAVLGVAVTIGLVFELIGGALLSAVRRCRR